MNSRLSRRLIVTTGALLGLAACSEPPVAAPTPSLTVALAVPEQRTIAREVVASGDIAAWEEVAVGVELSELRVSEVTVEVGSVVRRGDVLLRLDARTVEAQLSEAEAAVSEATANLDLAERQAARKRSLADKRAVAQQEAEEAEASLISARARLGTAVASRDAARVNRDFTVVRAPVNGVVSARSVHPGQVVSAGTELLRLIRDGRLEWRAEIAQHDLVLAADGADVSVQAPDRTLIKGKVRRISPSLDPRRRTGTVYADLPAPGMLRAGMFAKGKLKVGQSSALLVPVEAVVRRDGRAYVFVVDTESRARERPIESGTTVDDAVEVRSGLRADERVVGRGAGFLADGDLVRVVTASALTEKAS